MPWNPRSPDDSAQLLGLANVPLFGADRENAPAGTHSVLLDGWTSSHTLSYGGAHDLLAKDAALGLVGGG